MHIGNLLGMHIGLCLAVWVSMLVASVEAANPKLTTLNHRQKTFIKPRSPNPATPTYRPEYLGKLVSP